MRRVTGVLGLSLLMLAASGCYLYFDDNDDDPGRPIRDAGIVQPDAEVADAPPCNYPEHSSECAEVSDFQCGFMASCEGDTLVASWHEHVFCGEVEDIVEFTCSHECAGSCVEYLDWPASGADLVADGCTEAAGCTGLDEDACTANPDCKPVYSGNNCTDPDGNTCTGGDTDCTCETFEYAVCVDRE